MGKLVPKHLMCLILTLVIMCLLQGCNNITEVIELDQLNYEVNQVDELMVFEKMANYIRYFYPNKRVEILDWNKYMVYATDQIITKESKTHNLSRLQELLKPIVPEIIVSNEPVVRGDDSREVNGDSLFFHWYHHGYKSNVGQSSELKKFRNEIMSESLEIIMNKYENQYSSIEIDDNLYINIPVFLPEDRYLEKDGVYKKSYNDLKRKVEKYSTEYYSREVKIADLLVLSGFVNNLYIGYDRVDSDWNESLKNCVSDILIEAEDSQSSGMLKQLKKLNNTYARVEKNNYLKKGYLPGKFEWIDGRVVVTQSLSDVFMIGDIVTSIDGMTPEAVVHEISEIQPGNKAVSEFFMINKRGELNTSVNMNIERNGDKIEISAPYSEKKMIRKNSDTDNFSELQSNVIYVKLDNGFELDDFENNIDYINNKRGLIVDCSDYVPNLDIYHFLSLFASKKFEVYGEIVLTLDEPGFDHGQYEQSFPIIEPGEISVTVPVVFISDVTTVGKMEEMLNIVKAEKFGLVVGKNTAGFSGDITYLMLPSENAIRLNSTIYAFKEKVIGNEGVEPDIEVIRSHKDVINLENTYVDRAVQVIINGFRKKY